MRMGSVARINLAMGMGLVLLLIFVAAAEFAIDAFLHEAQQERVSQEAMLVVEGTARHLKTAESWQRKFLITAQPEDLKAYQAAASHVVGALGRTRGLRTVAGQRELLDELAGAIEQRLVNMERAVRVRQESGMAAASELVSNRANSELRMRIDGLIERVKAGEAEAVQSQRRETQQSASAIRGLILTGGLMTVVLLGGSVYLINRFALARRAAEARLAESIAQVERVSASLRSSEAQLRDVLDTVPVTFGYVDSDQRLRFHNRAYEESLGLRYDQIRGRTLRQVLGAALYEKVQHHIADAFSGLTVTYERQQTHADGQARDYEIKYFPRYGDSGEVVGVYAMGREVTEVKRIERMKSEFVATVSHELRTPLTSIRGALKLIAGGVAGPLPDKAKPLVDMAVGNCERLVRLVNDILDLDKLESGQLRLEIVHTPLEPILRKAADEIGGLAAQHEVTLELQGPAGELQADVDPDRLMQVFTNLLSNAVRFSPRGATVRASLARDGEVARIEVSDQGPGIPEEFESRIFQRFSQADGSSTRQKSGSGLGLNISKALVERMAGSIGYRSAPGATTFFVLLPL